MCDLREIDASDMWGALKLPLMVKMNIRAALSKKSRLSSESDVTIGVALIPTLITAADTAQTSQRRSVSRQVEEQP